MTTDPSGGVTVPPGRANEVAAGIESAFEELQQTMAEARAALNAVRSQPLLTAAEQRELQRTARSGELGPDMRRLAQHVEARETTWAEAFEGVSPYTDLLRDHLDRSAIEHTDAVRRALEADETFDPWASHLEQPGPPDRAV